VGFENQLFKCHLPLVPHTLLWPEAPPQLLNKSSLSVKKGKRVKKLTKKAEKVEAAAAGKLVEKAGNENKKAKAKDKSERVVSVP
jgi:hypothetical protein